MPAIVCFFLVRSCQLGVFAWFLRHYSAHFLTGSRANDTLMSLHSSFLTVPRQHLFAQNFLLQNKPPSRFRNSWSNLRQLTKNTELTLKSCPWFCDPWCHDIQPNRWSWVILEE
jgi:hypothetical protein